MSKLKLTVVFMFLLLLSMVITMPASFVLKQIKLDKNVTFGAIQGSWWSFNADWVSYKEFVQQKIQVTLKPECLITVAICFDIDNEQAHISLKKSLLDDVFIVENSFFNSRFIELNPLLKTMLVKPSGSLEINIETFQFNQKVLLGLEGNVNWHSVGVEGEVFDLGSIGASIKHQPGLISLKLDDQSDKLDLSGDVKISNKGLINSNIQLTTLKNFPSSVKTIIQTIMKKRGNDIFEYKTKLSNQAIKRLKVNF